MHVHEIREGLAAQAATPPPPPLRLLGCPPAGRAPAFEPSYTLEL